MHHWLALRLPLATTVVGRNPMTAGTSVVWSRCEMWAFALGHYLFLYCWTYRCMPLHYVVTCPMQAPGKFFLDILLSSQINYYRNWPAWWCPTYQSLSIKPDVIWWEVQCDRTMPFWRVRYFTSICDVHSARLPLMWTSEIAERGFSCWF